MTDHFTFADSVTGLETAFELTLALRRAVRRAAAVHAAHRSRYSCAPRPTRRERGCGL